MSPYSGKQQHAFDEQLGDSWLDLARYFEIPAADRAGFAQGDQSRRIWKWLDVRGRLNELPEALRYIDREDIAVDVLERGYVAVSSSGAVWNGSPFPGLRNFTEDEAAIFCGREQESADLLQLVKNSRFAAVVGASGSGKSSLVRAGLIPRLAEIPNGKFWRWLALTPGGFSADPFLALALRLEPLQGQGQALTAQEIAEMLYRRGNLHEVVETLTVSKSDTHELLLFIDQFEELFTLVEPRYRQRFVAMMNKAVQSPKIRIVLAVRSDFLDHCLAFPGLVQLMNRGIWNLAAPGRDALYRMITGPAALAGLEFEDDLPGQIFADTVSESGSLAQMAFTLELLYRACQSTGTLTHSVYAGLGRVSDAIDREARKGLDQLKPSHREAVDEVFSALVTVDPRCGPATRNRTDLNGARFSEPALRFIHEFADRGFFVIQHDRDNRAAVELAHEILFTRWPLLDQWIRARFDDFCLLRRVREEAREWDLNGRPACRLWPREQLEQAARMCDRLAPKLENHERDFIRPEAERLIDSLAVPDLSHEARAAIGVRLAEIDDPRPGVGLDQMGLPEIAWCEVPGGAIVLEGVSGTFMVNPFQIARYPVTWAQYRRFVASDDGYRQERWWKNLRRARTPGEQHRKFANHPAECVSWFDAVAFCRWLSELLGYELRLPTEWEWQYAATMGEPERVFPWGDRFNAIVANTAESGLGRTTAVGLYPKGAAECGALDMSGNVWEWCLNEYENPANIEAGGTARRVVRGGAWDVDQDEARVNFRLSSPPGNRFDLLGFRLCRSP